MTRPTTLIVAVVVVLLHALLLAGRTVASVLSLAAFVATHPGMRWTPAVLVPTASGTLVGLVLAAGDVLLVVWLWRGARRARVVLTVLLVVSGLLVVGGVVSLLAAPSGVSAVPVALSTVQFLLCVVAVVLLWLAPTSAWLEDR